MDMTSVETFLRTTVAALVVKVVAAIIFWFVGRWLIGRVIRLVQAAMHRNHVDHLARLEFGAMFDGIHKNFSKRHH